MSDDVHIEHTRDTVANTLANADRLQTTVLSDNSDSVSGFIADAQDEAYSHMDSAAEYLWIHPAYKKIKKSDSSESYLDVEFKNVYAHEALYTSEYVRDSDGSDTFLRFRTNRVSIDAGSVGMIDTFHDGSGQDSVRINYENNDVDFLVYDASGNDLIKCDANDERVGMGTVSPRDAKLHVSMTNNTVDDVSAALLISHDVVSGGGAATQDFGVGLLFGLEDEAGNKKNAGSIDVKLVQSTENDIESAMVFKVNNENEGELLEALKLTEDLTIQQRKNLIGGAFVAREVYSWGYDEAIYEQENHYYAQGTQASPLDLTTAEDGDILYRVETIIDADSSTISVGRVDTQLNQDASNCHLTCTYRWYTRTSSGSTSWSEIFTVGYDSGIIFNNAGVNMSGVTIKGNSNDYLFRANVREERIGIGRAPTSEILEIEGRVYISDATAPGTTINKLYAVSGNLYWDGVQVNTGGGTPAGSNSEIQYNNSGAFGASANFIYYGGYLDIAKTSGAQLRLTNGTIGVSSNYISMENTSSNVFVIGNDNTGFGAFRCSNLSGQLSLATGAGYFNTDWDEDFNIVNVGGSGGTALYSGAEIGLAFGMRYDETNTRWQYEVSSGDSAARIDFDADGAGTDKAKMSLIFGYDSAHGADEVTEYEVLSAWYDGSAGIVEIDTKLYIVGDGSDDCQIKFDNSATGHEAWYIKSATSGGVGELSFDSAGLGATLRLFSGASTPSIESVGDFTVSKKTTFTDNVSFASEVDNGNTSTADTIDLSDGNKQKSTWTGNTTITIGTNPDGPCNIVYRLINDATGGYTIAWVVTSGTLTWLGGEPTWDTGANKVNIITMYFDGTDYWAAGRGES